MYGCAPDRDVPEESGIASFLVSQMEELAIDTENKGVADLQRLVTRSHAPHLSLEISNFCGTDYPINIVLRGADAYSLSDSEFTMHVQRMKRKARSY